MIDTDRKLRVFLCHSSEDKHTVRDFYNQLCTVGWVDPWLDEEKIFPGMNEEVEIERAIEIADIAIVFLSHNFVKEEGLVQRELKLVLDAALEKPEASIFVIPLKLDECEVPLKMRHYQPIDFSLPESRKEAYNRLLQSLKITYDKVNKRTAEGKSAHYASPQHGQTKPDLPPLTFGGFNFEKIPKGKFIIGSKASNPSALENEVPQCPCAISYDYWISRFPISNEQFSEFAFSTKCLTALPKDWRKKLNHPIVNVSWHEAVSYTHWLNEIFGKEIPGGMVLRLPTEVEWERASRGDAGGEWPWGNESLDTLLEKETASQKIKSEIRALRYSLNLTEVGSFSPLLDSPFKIADMMGSIIEWTQSLYAPYPYDAGDGRESLETNGDRVIRGCFTKNQERFSVRSARRAWAPPNRKESVLGFRIVVAPPIG